MLSRRHVVKVRHKFSQEIQPHAYPQRDRSPFQSMFGVRLIVRVPGIRDERRAVCSCKVRERRNPAATCSGRHKSGRDCVPGSCPDASAFFAKIARVFAIDGRKPETYCFADHVSADSRTESVCISFSALKKARRLISRLIDTGADRRSKNGFRIEHRVFPNVHSLPECQRMIYGCDGNGSGDCVRHSSRGRTRRRVR
jgi:hypothetical protein